MEMDHKHTNEIVSFVSLNDGGWPCRSFDDWSPSSHPGIPSSFPLQYCHWVSVVDSANGCWPVSCPESPISISV